jgi:acyl CoA:acetate/3-ketoacid CoA transferase beta subunit
MRSPRTAISPIGRWPGRKAAGSAGRWIFVERCAIPVTAPGVVNLVVTNYGLFEITHEGMALKEIAPGVTVDEVKATTGCDLLIPREVAPVRLRA